MRKFALVLVILFIASAMAVSQQVTNSEWNNVVRMSNQMHTRYLEEHRRYAELMQSTPSRDVPRAMAGEETVESLTRIKTQDEGHLRNIRSSIRSFNSLSLDAKRVMDMWVSIFRRTPHTHSNSLVARDNTQWAQSIVNSIDEVLAHLRRREELLDSRISYLTREIATIQEAARRAEDAARRAREEFLARLNQEEYNPFVIEKTNNIDESSVELGKEKGYRFVTWVNEFGFPIVIFPLIFNPDFEDLFDLKYIQSLDEADLSKYMVLLDGKTHSSNTWNGWWGMYDILPERNSSATYLVKNSTVFWFAYVPEVGDFLVWDFSKISTNVWGDNSQRYDFPRIMIDELSRTTYPFVRTELRIENQNIQAGEEITIYLRARD